MNKRKLIAPLVSLLLVCALLVPVMASPVAADDYTYPLQPGDTQIVDALDYLSSVQAADGSIGSYGDSAWAIMSIAAAGEDPHAWKTAEGNPSIVDYLRVNSEQLAWEFNPVTGYARVILAIVAACEDPSAFGEGDEIYAPGGDYISKLKSFFDEDAGQFTYESCVEYDTATWKCITWGTVDDTLNDDIWGLMALIAAGEPQDSPMVTSTADFIEANQGFDGGWSWATLDNQWWGSDTDDTAAALMALVAAGGASNQTIVDNALDYMHFTQGSSGGFQYDAWGAENLATTVWAVDAIVAIEQDPTSADWKTTGGNPVDFIMAYNKPDGSFLDTDAWSQNPYKNTADAIVALLGKPYPVIPTCPLPVSVSIDIKPGTFPNDINPSSRGRIPVAILTTDCFDAATVDALTVCFGPDEAEAVHHALKDVDGDGDVDMILHFKTQDTGISAGDTEATLTGETTDGREIVGTDSVRTVPSQ